MDKDSHAGRLRFPPSLSAAKSDFKKLCDELGDPPDIGVSVDKQYMELSCQDYPMALVLPILLHFQRYEPVARRHWPWAAVAISQYAFERSERAKYAEEPSPRGIREILEQIKKAARDLGSGIAQLQALSSRLNDPTAPLRRAHLAWLDAFIAQAIAGRNSNDVNEDDLEMLVDHFKKMGLLKRLENVQAAANTAKRRIDKSLLERERSQSDPALPSFIWGCSAIWKSMTGRRSSAEKVHRSVQRHETGDPDFVIFVQELAKCAGLASPSRNQVASSLRKFRPRN